MRLCVWFVCGEYMCLKIYCLELQIWRLKKWKLFVWSFLVGVQKMKIQNYYWRAVSFKKWKFKNLSFGRGGIAKPRSPRVGERGRVKLGAWSLEAWNFCIYTLYICTVYIKLEGCSLCFDRWEFMTWSLWLGVYDLKFMTWSLWLEVYDLEFMTSDFLYVRYT